MFTKNIDQLNPIFLGFDCINRLHDQGAVLTFEQIGIRFAHIIFLYGMGFIGLTATLRLINYRGGAEGDQGSGLQKLCMKLREIEIKPQNRRIMNRRISKGGIATLYLLI